MAFITATLYPNWPNPHRSILVPQPRYRRVGQMLTQPGTQTLGSKRFDESYPARTRTWNEGTKIPCVANYTTGYQTTNATALDAGLAEGRCASGRFSAAAEARAGKPPRARIRALSLQDSIILFFCSNQGKWIPRPAFMALGCFRGPSRTAAGWPSDPVWALEHGA